jgi:hypothetical protein
MTTTAVCVEDRMEDSLKALFRIVGGHATDSMAAKPLAMPIPLLHQ